MPLYRRRLLIAFLFVACIGSSVVSAVSAVLELDADLDTNPPGCVRGGADFTQDAQGQREFSVEFVGFRPGAEVPVHVAGEVVGIIDVTTCGEGRLDFTDNPKPGEAAFPANFPQLTGEERVQVGPLRGTLQPQTGGVEPELAVELDAHLFAAFPSCFRGDADFTQEAQGQRAFSVEVAGFTLGRRLAVNVAGVGVGTIEIDACGEGGLDFTDNPKPGEAAFPANFPQLTGGERVQVGPLRGTLN